MINKAGGSGAVATAYVATKKGDPYTIAEFNIVSFKQGTEANMALVQYLEAAFNKVTKTDPWAKYVENEMVMNAFMGSADFSKFLEREMKILARDMNELGLVKKFEFPAAPIALALILGPMVERALYQSLTLSHGSLSVFVTRPYTVAFLALVLLELMVPVYRWWKKKPEFGEDDEV